MDVASEPAESSVLALSVVAPFVVLQYKSRQAEHVRNARKHSHSKQHKCTIITTIAANETHHRRIPAVVNSTNNTARTKVNSSKACPVRKDRPARSFRFPVLLERCRLVPRHPRRVTLESLPRMLLNLVVWSRFQGTRLLNAREMSKPSRKPSSLNFTDTLALDLDGSDKSTSANQVPVSVLSCSGRSNPSSSTPVPLAGHAQEVTIRSHATDVLQLLASGHASNETSSAAADDHTTNQRSDDRPRQAHLTARARASEPSSERECRTPGVRVPPDGAETRSHGRDVRARREGSASQPGRPIRWTHPREPTGRSESSTGWRKMCGRTKTPSSNDYRRGTAGPPPHPPRHRVGTSNPVCGTDMSVRANNWPRMLPCTCGLEQNPLQMT